MDPLVTSSLISAGSGLLGGAFGGGQKTPRYYPYYKAMLGPDVAKNTTGAVMNGMIETEMFNARMKAAKKNNIHPLSMLGVQFGGTAQPTATFGGEDAGSKWGNALAETGQGISRAVAAWSSREERAMAKTSAKLNLENQQLQNDRLRSEIALMHGAGSPPGMSGMGNNSDARYPTQALMPLGYGDTAPLLRKGVDPFTGKTVRVYNDDLGDNEAMQFATFPLTAFDFVANLGQSTGDWLRSKGILPKNMVWPSGRR